MKVHGEKWIRKVIYGVNAFKTGGLTCGPQLCTLCLLTFSLLFSSGGGNRVLCLVPNGFAGKAPPWEAGVQAAGTIQKG